MHLCRRMYLAILGVSTICIAQPPGAGAQTAAGANESADKQMEEKNKAKPVNYCVGRSASADQPVCLVTGAFMIPFRAELTGKKDVFGGVSADAFIGMSFPKAQWVPTLLVYAGYLPTFSSTSSDGGSSSSNGALDFGVGVAFPFSLGVNPDINQTPHAGVVLGFDQTSSANHFSYNGKPYISVFFGLSF